MSIPLDRLYHYIENIAREIHGDVIIYRFWPHGSKKIEDLGFFRNIAPEENWFKLNICPELFCNDQEPLNYDLYKDCSIDQHLLPLHPELKEILSKHNISFPEKYNFRGRVKNIWDQAILLHSEMNSVEVKKYQDCQFLPVYYWCHAMIARDWFRFAQHVTQLKNASKTFLIYNRAWTGTREYRLKFLDLIIKNNLVDHCRSSFNPLDSDSGTHYSQHNFKNSKWKPNLSIEVYFPPNHYDSNRSADFEIEDYQSTQIEVVLETIFDDTRWHLTEKILRPIACAQPFILAATHGSLDYLKSYGFQTFDSVWDESYDQETDPEKRLNAIIKLMNQIAKFDSKTMKEKMSQAQCIADYNKKHFFSQEFTDMISDELKQNLGQAFAELKKNNTSRDWVKRFYLANSLTDWVKFTQNNKTRTAEQQKIVLKQVEFYSGLSLTGSTHSD